jgi:hypothetical protein
MTRLEGLRPVVPPGHRPAPLTFQGRGWGRGFWCPKLGDGAASHLLLVRPLFLRFLFFLGRQPFQRRRVRTVDEEDSVEMVHLMLDHARGVAFGADSDGLASLVKRLDHDLVRTLDHSAQARNRQASLRRFTIACRPSPTS